MRKIKPNEDLYRLFTGCDRETEPETESFSELLEYSLKDKRSRDLLVEKEAASLESRPAPIREVVKSYPPPEQEIDLHRHTVSEAITKTTEFVREASARGFKTVRIIVGKGLHSRGRAVLPDAVEQKIVSLKKDGRVLTFAWEKRSKQRSGSLVVYLNSGTK